MKKVVIFLTVAYSSLCHGAQQQAAQQPGESWATWTRRHAAHAWAPNYGCIDHDIF